MAHTVAVPFRRPESGQQEPATEDLDSLAYETWLTPPPAAADGSWALFKKVTTSYALFFYARKTFNMQDTLSTGVMLVSDILFVRLSAGAVDSVADDDVVAVLENITGLL